VNLILVLDIIGTVAFAVSGVLTAMNRRMDPFGILIVASAAAIGGGTLRDVLIGVPVMWMHDLTYLYVILATTIITIPFRKRIRYIRRSLFLFDTIGLALYTVVGVEKGIEAGFSPVICIVLGTMTASFGGVLRDILSNKIPIIFRKEIYATASILGGVTYFILTKTPLSNGYIVIISMVSIMIIRLLAIYFDLSLPNVYTKSELESIDDDDD
jgi:uncharacterized membrane protein YeiH